MKSFITESFLLKNSFAEKLYHDYARALPIVDYHNHLPPDEIAADRKFENLSRIWLRGDHYKWRAMRAFGITETFITGDASDQENFRSGQRQFRTHFAIRSIIGHT
jgi:glucuronate isomerase